MWTKSINACHVNHGNPWYTSPVTHLPCHITYNIIRHMAWYGLTGPAESY